METQHVSFWADFAGRIGTPIFAATLVASLLGGEMRPVHYVLLAIGLALIYLNHRWVYHGKSH